MREALAAEGLAHSAPVKRRAALHDLTLATERPGGSASKSHMEKHSEKI